MVEFSERYKVIRFDYSEIDKVFSITAEGVNNNRIVRMDIYSPSTDEITNAIDYYTISTVKSLETMLTYFDI